MTRNILELTLALRDPEPASRDDAAGLIRSTFWPDNHLVLPADELVLGILAGLASPGVPGAATMLRLLDEIMELRLRIDPEDMTLDAPRRPRLPNPVFVRDVIRAGIPTFEKLLHCSEPEVRAMAALLLGTTSSATIRAPDHMDQLRREHDATTALLRLLRHGKERSDRIAAVIGLEKLHPSLREEEPQQKVKLEAMLLRNAREPDPLVRAMVGRVALLHFHGDWAHDAVLAVADGLALVHELVAPLSLLPARFQEPTTMFIDALELTPSAIDSDAIPALINRLGKATNHGGGLIRALLFLAFRGVRVPSDVQGEELSDIQREALQAVASYPELDADLEHLDRDLLAGLERAGLPSRRADLERLVTDGRPSPVRRRFPVFEKLQAATAMMDGGWGRPNFVSNAIVRCAWSDRPDEVSSALHLLHYPVHHADRAPEFLPVVYQQLAEILDCTATPNRHEVAGFMVSYSGVRPSPDPGKRERPRGVTWVDTSFPGLERLLGDADPVIRTFAAYFAASTGTRGDTWKAVLRGRLTQEEDERALASLVLAMASLGESWDATRKAVMANKPPLVRFAALAWRCSAGEACSAELVEEIRDALSARPTYFFPGMARLRARDEPPWPWTDFTSAPRLLLLLPAAVATAVRSRMPELEPERGWPRPMPRFEQEETSLDDYMDDHEEVRKASLLKPPSSKGRGRKRTH